MGGTQDTNSKALTAEWVAAFGDALEAGNPAAVTDLFLPEGHWRDILALDWQIRTVSGARAIARLMQDFLSRAQVRDVRLSSDRTGPRRVTRAGVAVIEAIFAFETAVGTGSGVVRLVPDPVATNRLVAWTVVTTLDALHQRTEAETPDYSREFGGDNWLDQRSRVRTYQDRDPAVVVVGAGQAGLSLAARLGALGIDTLIVDREKRIGDNWRQRYHSLTLHNEVHVNHLPFMPFPPTWPVFIPKDKLANWFEAYAESMELNVWTETELVGGSYDHAGWTLTVRHAGGNERVMRPQHLVFATGVRSIPVIPDLPGIGSFAGTVMHSGVYTNGAAWRGRRAFVLGTGNSGHDVAQDLYASGAHVTLIQRSPSYVVSLKEAQSVYAIYGEGIPTADCDLLATATPYPVLVRAYQLSTAASRDADRPLLDGLTERGFRLDFGEDDTGFQMKYLRRGGGYYFNVGCSDLIIDGKVGLLQYDHIDRFVAAGAQLCDGSITRADLLVLATGYKNQQDVARASLGDTVADRVGPVWGFDEGGELRNMWRPTAQSGLWFTAGSLAQCRIYSKYLALQIQARLDGMTS